MLKRTCTSVRTCNRLFPVVDMRYVIMRFKAEKKPSLSGFVACETKSKLTVFPTSLIKKLLFRDISCNFLIMVLITIRSLSLSSNRLGNNFNCDTNLLMPTSSLIISCKKVLSCNWLATNNNFWFRHELKVWISGALFQPTRFSFDNLTHVVFWTKGELVFKNQLKHFTETHRKTSNFDMCLLNFISTCHFCFIQKIFYHLKRNWPRFSLPKFCRSNIYVITIVKFSNSPIQNVFSFPRWTSMNFCKVKNPLKRSVLKSKFQNPQNLDEKNRFFSRFMQK